jgi:hypothetical protein
MSDWNLGSVTETVFDLVDDIPTSFTNQRITEIADRQRVFCENYTGKSIGSNAISPTFQDPILNLTISKVTSLMNLQGSDAESVKLGDFSTKKGGGTNLVTQSKMASVMAFEDLRLIGKSRRFRKANG